MSISVGDVIQIPILRLALGGDSVGRLPDGRVCFVRGAPISDAVSVRLSVVKRKFTRADLVDVFESPLCSVAAECGGCPWHLSSSDVQRSALLEHAQRSFQRLEWSEGSQPLSWGGRSPNMAWRRTIRAHWHGKEFGFFAWGTHQIITPPSCSILVDSLERTRVGLSEYFAKVGQGQGTMRVSVDEAGFAYLSIHPASLNSTDTPNKKWERLCTDLMTSLDSIAGVECVVSNRVVFRSGAQTYPVGRLATAHHIGGFVQSNHLVHDAFIDYVTDQVEPAQRVLELFAGAGPFTIKLLESGCTVLALEGSVEACAVLGKAARHWVERNELEVRQQRIEVIPKGQFDVCLLDPPRAGAKTLVSGLKPDRIKRIVYVACDFGTLIRDLGVLNRNGYTIQRARLFEMFPNSGHVECVVSLDAS